MLARTWEAAPSLAGKNSVDRASNQTMNISRFSKLLLVSFAMSLMVTACKKNTKGPTPIYEGRGRVPTDRQAGPPMEPPGPAVPADSTARTTQLPVSPSGTELTDRRDINNYFQDRDTFKQQTVYFDFDRYNVKTSELPKLQAV